MQIEVRESTMVQPAKNTPLRRLWISDIDLTLPRYHSENIYFYRRNETSSSPQSNLFFDTHVLKDALSRVLVHFYPLAGRLDRDKDGRIEINCNAEGVLFVEAETSSSIDDLMTDFAPTLELSPLVPEVDYSQDISAYPLILVQVTNFKCGGVSVSIGAHHNVIDGTSRFHFVNAWSDLARGLDVKTSPVINRTFLRAQDPPEPTFNHIEYTPPPPLKSTKYEFDSDQVNDVRVFKLTKDHLNTLKTKLREDINSTSFSTFVTVAGHVWRSVCIARGLADDQETNLYILADGRSRIQPPIPLGYLGNGVFTATATALAGDIQSQPTWYTANKINDCLSKGHLVAADVVHC